MSNVTRNWELTQKDRKTMATLVNKNRTTWAQLNNYYKKSPSRIMPRIEALAMKMTDAIDLADEYDSEPLDDASNYKRETIEMARRYRVVWTEALSEIYTDLVAEYTNIYNGEE